MTITVALTDILRPVRFCGHTCAGHTARFLPDCMITAGATAVIIAISLGMQVLADRLI